MSKEERLRLLLIEQGECEENHRTSGIANGAAAVFAKWPSYIASAIWFILFILSLITVIVVITFMSLLNQGKIVEQNVYFPGEDRQFMVAKDIKNEFCTQMTAKTHEKRQSIPEKDLEVFDSGNNIFYLVLKPLDVYSSCSVESLLRLAPNKNVFLIFLKQAHQSYENALRVQYKNFNVLNLEGKSITRGSPFEGKWKADDWSLFEVALLTVWQFGGMVLSENLLMLNNKLYDKGDSINCQIDPELIYCPTQCASYLYDLIGETLRLQRNESMDNLIDSSIMKFCGSEHFIHTGCNGIVRIDRMEMCTIPDDNKCMFVRIREWIDIAKKNNMSTWEVLSRHCPVTHKYENVLERTHSITPGEDITRTIIKETTTHINENLYSTSQHVAQAIEENITKHIKSTINAKSNDATLNSKTIKPA